MKININEFEKSKQFIKVVTNYESDIFLKSGRFVIDAKSVMGIFSLDLSKELEVEIIERTEGEKDKLYTQLRELGIVIE